MSQIPPENDPNGVPAGPGTEGVQHQNLQRLAQDVQRVRDIYRGVEADTDGVNAPTTRTIADFKATVQEIAAVHNELNDYGIVEESVSDASGVTIARITAVVNFNTGPSGLFPAAPELDVRESSYMSSGLVSISAGSASHPEVDENALLYQILSTEEGDRVQKLEVSLPRADDPEMHFVPRVPTDEELQQIPDLLRRAYELAPSLVEAEESIYAADTPELESPDVQQTARLVSEQLGSYTLTLAQQEAAAEMIGAADGTIAREYGRRISASERRPLEEVRLAPKHKRAIDRVSTDGQRHMVQRYGAVYPHFRPGYLAHLGYNNGDHTQTFAGGAARLSQELGLSPTLAAITYRVVPQWHDIDQTNIVRGLPRLGQDERVSTEVVVAKMRREKLPKYLAEVAAYGILGTWVVVDANGVVVGQWGGLPHTYPSKDAEMAARSAASADLSGIYAPRGPYDGHMLYAQQQGVLPGEVPPLDGFARYLTGRRGFLEGHRYPIEEANELFTGLKREVIAYNETVLRQVEAGAIVDPAIFWRDLRRQDIEFMREHSS